MTESTTAGRRRPRRSTRVSQQLEAARQRNAEQLAKRQAREKQVDDALRTFFDARAEITAAHDQCEEKVAQERRKIEQKTAPHHRKIEQLQAENGGTVAEQQARQATAALTIHVAGPRTVEQVAELLAVPQREARRLIAAGREAATAQEPTTAPAGAARPPHSPDGEVARSLSQEQAGLGHIHPPDDGVREDA